MLCSLLVCSLASLGLAGIAGPLFSQSSFAQSISLKLNAGHAVCPLYLACYTPGYDFRFTLLTPWHIATHLLLFSDFFPVLA